MIAGYRPLVPQLRLVAGLDFDVMPMPVLDSARDRRRRHRPVPVAQGREHARRPPTSWSTCCSTEAVSRVTRTGYLVPANLEVALTDAFLQPGRQPEHAAFFNTSVRSMRLPPLIDTLAELEAAVAARPRAARVRRRRARPGRGHPGDRRDLPHGAGPRVGLGVREPVRSTLRSSSVSASGSAGLDGLGLDLGREDRVDQDRARRARSATAGRRSPASCSATAGASVSASRDLRRRPQRAAQVVGGEQVLDREVVLLGERGDRLAGEREPPGGDRVLLGPGAGERRAVAARGPGRQVGLVHLGDLARAPATQRVE